MSSRSRSPRCGAICASACAGVLPLALCWTAHQHFISGKLWHWHSQRARRPGGASTAAAVCLTQLPAVAAQALFDLEATNQELKSDLRDLYITSAKEVDVAGGARKAIIVHVRTCFIVNT